MKAALLLLLAAPLIAHAQQQTAPSPVASATPDATAAPVPGVSVQVAAGFETLSNNTPNWREQTLQVRGRMTPAQTWGVGLTRTSRFGLDDTQVNATYAHKISPSLTATIEGTASPTHRVLPRNSVGAQVDYEFMPAWVAQVGAKTKSYDAVRANQLLLGVEHYVGNFSVGAAWLPSRAFGKTVNAAQLRGNYYYGDGSSVGVLLASGREVTPLASAVAVANVRAIAIIGRHRLAPKWNLTYAVNRTVQGDLYTRRGVNVGIEYAL